MGRKEGEDEAYRQRGLGEDYQRKRSRKKWKEVKGRER